MTRPRPAPRSMANREARKERKTFTLSRDSLALLEELRSARKGSPRRPASAVLDELLRMLHRERRRQAVERAIAQYYSRSSVQDQKEAMEWGEFALAQFPEEET